MDAVTRTKIDAIWQGMWDNGMADAKTNITQITYLLFIKMLDDAQIKKEANARGLGVKLKHAIFPDGIYKTETLSDGSVFEIKYEDLRWHNFVHFSTEKMFHIVKDYVFTFISELHSSDGSAFSRFMSKINLAIQNGKILEKVVRGLDDEELNLDNRELMGDVYEYLLSKLAVNGTNGQFRTPRHIIRMMVELMDPAADEVICDPACGTAGFLVSAGDYLKEKRREEIFYNREKKDHYMNHMFFGYDMDRTMLRIGAMNMMTHGVDNPYIEYRDSLSDQNPDKNKYSLILANPPFKGSLDSDTVSADLLKVCKTKKTELLFIALFLRMLKTGGRCACIVPEGVLFGSSSAHKAIRKSLIEDNILQAVISMPSGVFKPYAGVSTAVLIFTKTEHGGTDKVWFYDMQADGFSLDDKRTPIAENDIPDIVARFKNLAAEEDRARTEKSFLVPKAEIVENDYDLSINKYKKTEYKPVEYAPTTQIMAELNELEIDITAGLAELEDLLGE